LILRYPADKQSITGIAYEPWHFRYVGQPHATYMAKHNLTLEEYLVRLQQTGGYFQRVGGTYYAVTYHDGSDQFFKVPQDAEYSSSSTNTGDFVVTSWR